MTPGCRAEKARKLGSDKEEVPGSSPGSPTASPVWERSRHLILRPSAKARPTSTTLVPWRRAGENCRSRRHLLGRRRGTLARRRRRLCGRSQWAVPVCLVESPRRSCSAAKQAWRAFIRRRLLLVRFDRLVDDAETLPNGRIRKRPPKRAGLDRDDRKVAQSRADFWRAGESDRRSRGAVSARCTTVMAPHKMPVRRNGRYPARIS
jgi:hypothetical protein